MYFKKPILITGSHRSGSTWVGKILAESLALRFIPEPFNLNNFPCKCGQKFNYWFQYVSPENESIFYRHVKHSIDLSYNFIGEVNAVNTPEEALKLLTNSSKFFLRRILNIRPLVKDPIALFSAEWLASKFDMDVVVLIRHPAAFASSLKRLNWTFPFSHFLEQPLLMKDHLQPFECEIREYAYQEHDIIDQAILLWRIIHYRIIKYKKNQTSWIFLRHEDLSRNPLINFQNLFSQLNLDFTENVVKIIQESTSSLNPSEIGEEVHCLKRNSQSNIWNWKNRLNSSEIGKIRAKVEDIASVFYSNEDW
jgi:hypothetical protein